MLGFLREILTFRFIKGKRSFCNMQIKRLSRKEKDGEQIPKHLFLTQTNRCLCLLYM